MEPQNDIDDLPKNPANFTALTPLWFLERAATVHPTRKSVVYESKHYTWQQTYQRCRRLASALFQLSIGPGTAVSVLSPNVPAMYEVHFGVPMTGAVLNCINFRLNPLNVAFILGHAEAALVFVDQQYFALAEEALKIMEEKSEGLFKPPVLIVIGDETCDRAPLEYALSKGVTEYEKLLETGDPEFAWKPPRDEWQSIALGYTSGTTANPKGVLVSHRAAYLMSLNVVLTWGMKEGAVYLWTLPIFHGNGWCFTWSLAALCGTSVMLRQASTKAIYKAIAEHGVTNFCAAPIVLNSIVNAPPEDTILPLPHVVNVNTGGSPPPPPVLLAMTQKGFRVTHVYGLSEINGPATVCAWNPNWDSLPFEAQARLNARQGVKCMCLEGLDVLDTKTNQPIPADGKTIGEVVMRGNMVMKGYLKNPKANEEAFANGWFHTGDLAVKHPDNYIEIKDRSKDIIISGGENISSVEVENVLYTHPSVLEASVVARPDKRWGESPCAFVALRSGGGHVSDERKLAEDLMKYCRSKIPSYWVPKSIVFGPLPKSATGKIQKNVLRATAKELGTL